MCVGTTCWTCGEPSELRDMRRSIQRALGEEGVRDGTVFLAQVAAKAIREDVIGMLTTVVQLQGELHSVKCELEELKELHRTADVEE